MLSRRWFGVLFLLQWLPSAVPAGVFGCVKTQVVHPANALCVATHGEGGR